MSQRLHKRVGSISRIADRHLPGPRGCLAWMLLAAALLPCSIPAASRAQDLYVQTQPDAVFKYDATTGSLIRGPFIAGLSNASSLSISGDNIFILNSGNGTVGVYNAISGVAVKSALISGLGKPSAMAVSGGYVYVTSTATGLIAQYDAKSGVPINAALVGGLNAPSALAVSGQFLYVANRGDGTVGQYSATTGAVLNASFITGLSAPSALAISGQLLYVASGGDGRIGEYEALTGVPLNASLITGVASPCSLAVRDLSLYAGSSGSGAIAKYISTTGALIDPTLIATATNVTGMTVTPLAPSITSATRVTGTAGFPFRYQIVATNNPTGYSSTHLPAGLALDSSTGLVSGTPQESGTFSETITATNLGGNGNSRLTLILRPLIAPVITSPRKATGELGVPFHYKIAATNFPDGFDATALPPGLNINTSTGLINGTPTQIGKFATTISATNLAGTRKAPLDITIKFDFPASAGAYRGFVTQSGSDEGLFLLTLASNGAFTGDLELATARYPLSGLFSIDGIFTRAFKVGRTDLNVTIAIVSTPPEITGTISAATTGGTNTYIIASNLLGQYNPKTIPPGVAGRYTAIIPAISGTDPAIPQAPGYATMTIANTGAVQLSGKLGDGTPFTTGSHLEAGGTTWTLFAPLYVKSGGGGITGAMTIESTPLSDSEGRITWMKPATSGSLYPAPFAVITSLLAATYTPPPLASGTASLAFTGGGLPAPGITDSINISPTNKVTVTGSDSANLTLIPSTGAFTGKFANPVTGKETPFAGAIYPLPTRSGLGSFIGANATGSVSISP